MMPLAVVTVAVALLRQRRRSARRQRLDQLAAVSRELIVAEYTQLRQEQFNRTVGQQGLLNVNFAGSAALAGFAASQASRDPLQAAYLLMLIPALSFVVGLAFYDAHQSILLVGRYIRQELEALAREGSEGSGYTGWHDHITRPAGNGRTVRPRRDERILDLSVPLSVGAPGLLALTVSGVILAGIGMSAGWVLWAFDVVLLLVLDRLWRQRDTHRTRND